MGLLPWALLAFLLGLWTRPLGVPWGAGLLCGVVGLAVWLRRESAVVGVLLVVAALALGSLRAPEEPPARTRAPTVQARRLRAEVTGGCSTVDESTHCRVSVSGLGEALLRAPAGRCEASTGDALELIATVREEVPLRNPPLRPAPGPERVLLDTAGCDVSTPASAWRAAPWRVAEALRRALSRGLRRSLDDTSARRAEALLLGATRGLPWEVRRAFRETGLSHLLAVSGAHVALLASLAAWLTRRALLRVPSWTERGWSARAPAVLAVLVAGLFVLVTGAQPASQRALLTGALGAALGLLGRRPEPLKALAGVALAMVLVTPSLAEDLGWQLSVLATWALVTGERRRSGEPSPLRRAWAYLVAAVVASVRVALALVPLVLWTSGRTPATACLVNVLAAPLGEVLALPATLALAVLGNVLPTPIALVLGVPVKHCLAALYAMPELAGALPGSTVALPTPTPGECLVATVALALALAARPRARVVLVVAGALVVAALECDHRALARPRGVLRVTALDVGQGDAILVDLPDGEAMLVDAGGPVFGARLDPGERAVVPTLALRRRERLAVVVLSHPHPDHAGGLGAVLSSVAVGELWDTGQGASLGAPRSWAAVLALARERAVPVRGPSSLCGPPRPFHGATIEVLAPCPEAPRGLGANDASFVLRLVHGRASVLLPGDLEGPGERTLLGRLGPVTALKVPHHGSRTSSSEAFLARLQPRVALVSAGHPSPFGHPHPEVVLRYARRGIALRRTDLEGAVSVTLHPDGTFEHGQARSGR